MAMKEEQAVVALESPDRGHAESELRFIQAGEDESNRNDDEMMEDDEEKDENEEELERLVFGDSAGFRHGLKDLAVADVDQQEDAQATGFEGLRDADLFVADLGLSTDANQVPKTSPELEDTSLRSRHPAAWEDSDDERMIVSLASVPRLRKLRRTETEDVVNGREYSRRLRMHFELLNPTPKWAVEAMQQPARKKRRLSDDAGSDGDVSGEGMDTDPQEASAAPLAKLLRDAESLVRQAGPGRGKKRIIRPEVLAIQKTRDVPGIQPSTITSLSFHPKLPLLLSSGPSSTLYLHHITPSPPAPSPNPLLTSMHVSRTPLSTTAFHPTDARIFLSSREKYFHAWDLNSGRVEKISQIYGQQHKQNSMERFKLSPDGEYMALLGSTRKGGGVVIILSASTLQWTDEVRIEGRGGIADFCWWRDGRGLTVSSKGGEISEWSVLERRVVARWQDEGAVGSTTLALGGQHEFHQSPIGTDRWIVTGSSSGIVNIYDRRAWLAAPTPNAEQVVPFHPLPTRILDHLTTPTSNLAFSPDGQILAMSSQWRKDALRLIQLPSCTVFKNWPTSSTPLGRITSLAFAAGEMMEGDVHSVLAVANQQGKIRLWEIR